MTLHGGNHVLVLKIRHELRTCFALRFPHRFSHEVTLEANSERIRIGSGCVRSYLFFRAQAVNATILANQEMITSTRPSVIKMPLVNLLCCTRLSSGMVQYNSSSAGTVRHPLKRQISFNDVY